MIPHKTLEIFSHLWWQSNSITIMVILTLLMVGKFANYSQKELLAKLIGIVLIIRTIGIHFYWDYLGIWTIESSLPLQLCGLSGILSGVVLLWRKQWAYECLFYWGIPGAIHALITPEFTMGTEGFLFIEYYISHGGILLSAFYLTIVLKMKPQKGSWWKIFLASQILLPVIGFINYWLNANYLYLCVKPLVNNPFLIGDWPWYLLGVEFATFLHYFIIYIPFGIKYQKVKK